MIDDLKPGTLLVRTNTVLPKSLARDEQVVFPDWKVIRNIDAATMERQAKEIGWHFFFVVPPLEAGALAHTRERALIKALKRILASAELRKLNAIEITSVKAVGFWIAHGACIEANARHIAQKPILSDEQQPGRYELAAAAA